MRDLRVDVPRQSLGDTAVPEMGAVLLASGLSIDRERALFELERPNVLVEGISHDKSNRTLFYLVAGHLRCCCVDRSRFCRARQAPLQLAMLVYLTSFWTCFAL